VKIDGNSSKEKKMRAGRYENEDLTTAKELIRESVEWTKEIANKDLSKVDDSSDIACDIILNLEKALKLLKR
jgi:hypothetical protein